MNDSQTVAQFMSSIKNIKLVSQNVNIEKGKSANKKSQTEIDLENADSMIEVFAQYKKGELVKKAIFRAITKNKRAQQNASEPSDLEWGGKFENNPSSEFNYSKTFDD